MVLFRCFKWFNMHTRTLIYHIQSNHFYATLIKLSYKPFSAGFPVWFPFISLIFSLSSANCCFTSENMHSFFLQFAPAWKVSVVIIHITMRTFHCTVVSFRGIGRLIWVCKCRNKKPNRRAWKKSFIPMVVNWFDVVSIKSYSKQMTTEDSKKLVMLTVL